VRDVNATACHPKRPKLESEAGAGRAAVRGVEFRLVDQLLEQTYLAEEHHFWFRGFRRFVAPLVAEAVAGVARPRILDAGCGTGRNLEMLQAYGHASGIDLTALGLAFAARKGQRRVARATVTDLPFLDSSFDLVTSFDVLYALDDQQEARAFSEMVRVLRPGGAVVINVAGMEVVRGGHSAALGGELRRYTVPSMRQALERAGLRPVRLTYTNATLFPVLVGVRMLQRATGWPVPGVELKVPAAPVNAVLSGVTAAEAWFVRHANLPFGSSVLCLARKAGA
jgi:SAM-dependent methyltransferase